MGINQTGPIVVVGAIKQRADSYRSYVTLGMLKLSTSTLPESNTPQNIIVICALNDNLPNAVKW